MITQDNIKAILDELSVDQLKEFDNSEKDIVCLILHTSNVGFTVELKFDTFVENFQEELDNGNIACDKDDFASYLNYYEVENWKNIQSV